MRPITAEEYAAACALAPAADRDSARDTAARTVAVSAARGACPRCTVTFTPANPAEFCHYAPSAARVSSTGVWFGSVACRACNMRDEAARTMLGLTADAPMPFAYVSRFFHVPHNFTSRADIIRAARSLQTDVPSATSTATIDGARRDLQDVGLLP